MVKRLRYHAARVAALAGQERSRLAGGEGSHRSALQSLVDEVVTVGALSHQGEEYVSLMKLPGVVADGGDRGRRVGIPQQRAAHGLGDLG